jgi:hypothetical protein
MKHQIAGPHLRASFGIICVVCILLSSVLSVTAEAQVQLRANKQILFASFLHASIRQLRADGRELTPGLRHGTSHLKAAGSIQEMREPEAVYWGCRMGLRDH